MKIIAEIKKASPFKGLIAPDLNPTDLARRYTELGAVGISIVTAQAFQGELDWIRQVREVTDLPILRKDFITKLEQIEETRDAGATQLLLLAKDLDFDHLKRLVTRCHQLRIVPFLEVHTYSDLKKVCSLGYHRYTVLINNRNLETGYCNSNKTFELYHDVPCSYSIVSASCISKREEVERFHLLGIETILVGSALLQAENLEEKFKELSLAPD